VRSSSTTLLERQQRLALVQRELQEQQRRGQLQQLVQEPVRLVQEPVRLVHRLRERELVLVRELHLQERELGPVQHQRVHSLLRRASQQVRQRVHKLGRRCCMQQQERKYGTVGVHGNELGDHHSGGRERQSL